MSEISQGKTNAIFSYVQILKKKKVNLTETEKKKKKAVTAKGRQIG